MPVGVCPSFHWVHCGQVRYHAPPPDPPFIAHALMCALHSTDLRAATPIGNNTLN